MQKTLKNTENQPHTMKTIYKYLPTSSRRGGITVPEGAKIVAASLQGEQLVVHAIVDEDAPPTVKVPVEVFGTGHMITPEWENAHYLSTIYDGPYVWHVMVKLPAEGGITV